MVGTFPKYWVFITVSMSTMRKPSNMFTVFPFPFIYTPALLLAWDRIHYNANMKIKGKRKITDVSEEGRSLSNIHNFEKCLVKITVWQTWHAPETLPPCISVYHGECGVLWVWSVVATGRMWGGSSKMVKCDDEEEICSTGHRPSLLVHPRSSYSSVPPSPVPVILWTPCPWSLVRPLQKGFLNWYFCRVTSVDQRYN